MIENFALDRYGMNISKDALRDILQAATSEFDVFRDYHEHSNQGQHAEPEVELIYYPPSTEEIKFEFLRYCISSKAHNNPR